ncbi:ScyD/ScyE family protein [Angustibacter aerolatus]
MRTPTRVAVAAALTATAAFTLSPTSATAAARHREAAAPAVTPLTSDVFAPFQLAVSAGRLYVADGGTSTVSRVDGKGALHAISKGPQPGEVAGVAWNASHTTFAHTQLNYATGKSELVIKTGRTTVKADLGAFEAAKNPDAGVQYGIDDPTDCQKAAFEPLGGASPTGGVDSHAYAVAADGSGWIVADAGGNDLLRVSSTGKVSLLTVLPRQPSTITASAAAALGLPDCVIGAVYNFEPVPTDVEWRGGRLIVSLLPGGPEDPSLGARGSVYSVHPHSGKATWLAGGFLGATNVAVGHRGEIYVAELFAGRVSRIHGHSSTPYASVPGVVSITARVGTGLWGGVLAPTDDQGNPTGPGAIVRIG